MFYRKGRKLVQVFVYRLKVHVIKSNQESTYLLSIEAEDYAHLWKVLPKKLKEKGIDNCLVSRIDIDETEPT